MANEAATGTDNTTVSQESSQFTAPQITLPKGGGAIRGIGEKFAANAVTGTATFTIPVALSPGRSGFGPNIVLTYDSGTGNGPFGMGCTASMPSITRKTDKGLPRYRDLEESDVFILSGAEDLVPVLKQKCDGEWGPDEFEREGYRVKPYRPRIEGLFARIERWIRLKDGDVHWRSISKDNIVTLYGTNQQSRIFDPAAPDRIFSWLICQSYDDRGNGIVYEYACEDGEGVDLDRPNERHRVRTANRYLKRIKYGNRRPFLFRTGDESARCLSPAESDLRAAEWMFEAVFDYGEGYYHEATPDSEGCTFVDKCLTVAHSKWPARKDPFSHYRSGFEVRTYRLCQRVLMFHHFPQELGIDDYLVRATEFGYQQKEIGSFMTSVTQSGFKRQDDGRYLKKSLPPVELTYSESPLENPAYNAYEVKEVDSKSLENLPIGIEGGGFRWVDIDGEGISGVLSEQGDAWYYKPNLGNGHFGPTELIVTKPSVPLGSGRHEFLDVAGDGNLDLVQLDRQTQGFFERTVDAEWKRFRTFETLPVQDWQNPNLRFIDVTGDGIADILITEGDELSWHPSLLKEGFGERVRVPVPHDDEKGPRVLFSDSNQSIFLADMSGDGLSDIVCIREQETYYYPNLGYGKFGAKVRMDHSPSFEEADQFDARRIRLADTDGSGTTDIIYLGRKGIQIYLNEAGNGWSSPRTLSRFPTTNNSASVSVVDFLGQGTACVVWSSSLPADAKRPVRYVDLMEGKKPHLLTKVQNNLGAETRVEYASSTEFYLADKVAGKSWITKLPFPVHVVKRVETYDHIGRNRFVTTYRYHHGYFDAVEREFRGFGMVEQIDTEEFATLNRSDRFPSAENIDASSHVPPVLTKTWFHLGAFLKEKGISKQYAHEYYREGDASRGEAGLSDEQFAAMLLPDTILPEVLELEEVPEACRALKGSVLRQEIYGLDGSDAESRPYSVSERNYTIHLLQARRSGRHAVFFVHPREQIDFNYERRLFQVTDGKIVGTSDSSLSCSAECRPDPRVTHALTMDVDDYGNVLLAAAVSYGRRFDDLSTVRTPADREKQKQIHVTFTVNRYTNAVLHEPAYRVPLPSESQTFELLNVHPDSCLTGINNLFRFVELRSKIRKAGDGKHEIPYEDHEGLGVKNSAPHRRLIEHLRTLYRQDDCAGLLPLGQIQPLALPGESFKLAFTPGLLSKVFKRDGQDLLPDRLAVLRGEGGYKLGDDLLASGLFPDGPAAHWWIPSGKVFFSSNRAQIPAAEYKFALEHFFLPHRYEDPFGNNSFIAYDRHKLLLRETRDALDNTVLADSDYRVLQPKLIRDPNRNRSEVAFDTLGLVVGSAMMGKGEENKGDSLAGFEPDLRQGDVDAFFADPKRQAPRILASATTRTIYDFHRYSRTPVGTAPQPAFAAALAREMHVSDLKAGEESKIQVSMSYSDGFGREIQKKIQAEPGEVEIEHSHSVNVTINTKPNVRWVVSGWTIFNNKGKPVRQYEPFFSVDHQFQFGRRVGVSPIFLCDPLTRVVCTLHPNHTYEKVVFDPWQQTTWDVNDTVTLPDPRRDPDVGLYFTRLLESEFLPTWYARRKDGGLGDNEKDAAVKASSHTRTPATAIFDSLGRHFLSLVHNRFLRNGNTIDEYYATRTELDIEGNQRAVIDALERVAMRYDYDTLGNRIHQASMEAGERWMLNDGTGKPIRAWDSRGHTFRTEYDVLRRAKRAFVLGDKNYPGREILYQKTVHGEEQGDSRNHRTRVFQVFDTAGLVTNVEFDFKGNLLSGTRQLASEYKHASDWSANPVLEPEVFSSKTVFDALNRPVVLTTPDGSISHSRYNEANLLEQLDVNLQGADTATPFITNIDYNAKGQRLLIEYGMLDANRASKARTRYSYDPDTFRLTRLLTTRSSDTRLQDLNYSYDPVGNITSIHDDAQQTIYFKGQVVEPHNAYVYDAIYRLITADGREHIGQAAQPTPPTWDDRWTSNLPHPNDGQAMRRYREHYHYDATGNFLQMIHVANNGNWTRSYEYNEASLIDGQKVSNRLSATSIGDQHERFRHDAHGNMVRMPHLGLTARPRGENLDWDFADRLQSVDLPHGCKALYVYDGGGQRVRKVIELPNNGSVKEQRVYISGFEIYRKNGVNPLVRETLHVMDDTGRLALVETRTLDAAGDDKAPKRLIRYQFGNHLGSASVELDDRAEIISYEEYAPYGSSTYQAVRSQTETAKRYRYTGKERDEESGFYFHGARYYAPWLGRWMSADPQGIVDGANLFDYGRNNPLTFTDPTGTQCDPSTQSCIDPTEPTAREEALQQSLPENERYLPPPVDSSSSPSSPGDSPLDNQPRGPSGWSIASGGVGLTSLGLRTSFYPVNAAGEALRGPLILWTGSDALNRAREMAAAGRGYTIFDTPYFGAARAEELAMAREAMGLPESAIITDLTPELERQALPIWERYSYELTRDAAISGVGVETANAPGTIRPGSIQANVEGPWARGLGAGMGALNVAGGAFMLASIDTEHDPGLLTAGKITSGGLSVVGGGLEIYGGLTLTAGATTVGAGLAAGGAVIAVPIIVYEVGRPRGWVAIDPVLMERDTQRYRNGENVNPFCAQCHGRGGALDPNNDWNAGGARRAAFMNRLQWKYLGD